MSRLRSEAILGSSPVDRQMVLSRMTIRTDPTAADQRTTGGATDGPVPKIIGGPSGVHAISSILAPAGSAWYAAVEARPAQPVQAHAGHLGQRHVGPVDASGTVIDERSHHGNQPSGCAG